jgi:adenine-specific DNA-methyltransferase
VDTVLLSTFEQRRQQLSKSIEAEKKAHLGQFLTPERTAAFMANLYSAFVALAMAEAVPGGQIVAIIPRSFCNGSYYRPFRDFILERGAIRHLHLFESRNKAFKDDEVLQENLIIRLERGGQQGPVTVSNSTDDRFSDLTTHEYSFDRIVFPDDPERFIHVPTSPEQNAIERSPAIRYTPADLGIQVSTGPVVDFRLKAHLCDMPGPGAVPLLYPRPFQRRRHHMAH